MTTIYTIGYEATTMADFLAALDDVSRELRLPAYTVPAPRNSAAHRAAEHPTNFGLAAASPSAPPAEAAPTVARQRLFPGDDAPTRVSAPAPSRDQWPAAAAVPPPVVAPQAPVERVPAPAPQRPTVSPVSNRSPIGVAIYAVLALGVVMAIGLGAWWFGSGMYGEIPEIIVPLL